MSDTLFISDLHLSDEQPALLQLFLSFMANKAPAATALYILGDLFDVWLGDDDHSATAEQVKSALSKLSQTVPIHLQHGNRDFLLGEQFAADTGVTLLADEVVINLNKPILLMHGDLLCTDDIAYQQVRQQLRKPEVITDFLQKPLPERAQIAAHLRQQSGEATAAKTNAIMDVNNDTVQQYMHKHQVDTLIHGHTHKPAIHEFSLNKKPARRIVAGDWQPQGTKIIAVNNRTGIARLMEV